MPSTWIEDAQVLTELDLSMNRSSVLRRTPDVQDFLSEDKLPSVALVAPKGFGKTFILKLKRISLQEEGVRCLPADVIVDRPKDRPPALPHDVLDLMERSENWETLWQIAISISTIKAYQDDDEIKSYLLEIKKKLDQKSAIALALDNSLIETPFEIIHSLLTSSRSDFFEIQKSSAQFTSIFARLHRPTALFIDNIDEYLEHYISGGHLEKDDLYERYLRVWHNGQIGAWLAIRRLNGINPHIRVFVSLRKEAFHYAAQQELGFANLRAFSRELRYNISDIREIIDNNIRNEQASKLVERNASKPILMFVGSTNEFISNSGTGKQESLMDYWIRHCTVRPRDAVAIGKEISKITPANRNTSAVRATINNSAAERVQNLFSEVEPFFDSLFVDLFPRIIQSNVLTAAQIHEAAEEYNRLATEKYCLVSEATLHPFCALYAIGLIGIVSEDRDRPGQLIQKFAPVGQIPFGSIAVLPQAEKYLVHPALSDYIASKNVGFLKKLNRHNVVGDNLEWRSEEEVRFVAIGDMRGYREQIMNNVGASQTFNTYWTELFRNFTKDLDYAVLSAGDSVLLADRSATRLIRSLKALMISLNKSRYGLSFRFGAHSGFWRLNLDEENVAHPEISNIVGVAARIEPFARPGEVLISESFLSDAKAAGADLHKEGLKAAGGGYFRTGTPISNRGLLISKKGKETDEWVKVYALTVT